SFALPPLKKKPVEKNQNESPKVQTPSPMDYVVIADQNIFHPERRIPPDKKEEAALPKPEFFLYGTLITPEMKIAYVEDKKAPVSTPGRGKRQTALKKGESLSGFTLKEVLTDKVVMTRGEETLTILLEDPNSLKTREVSPTQGPRSHPPTLPTVAPPSSPMAGQPAFRPSPTNGRIVPPSPPPAGVGVPTQPTFPGAIAPGTPNSSAFPSRRRQPMAQ
ncbi:MAG: hypothetical protein C0407_19450, partial [Desulfobacca sp.]|nr:hypothetical protein [Desulfobacca sp.]